MKQYIVNVNASLLMGNHLLCILYTQSLAFAHNKNARSRNAPLMTVHHPKKARMISIFIAFLLVSLDTVPVRTTGSDLGNMLKTNALKIFQIL